MKKSLIISCSVTEVEFSDIDIDGDIEIKMTDKIQEVPTSIYIDKEDMIDLRNHLNYLLKKLEHGLDD